MKLQNHNYLLFFRCIFHGLGKISQKPKRRTENTLKHTHTHSFLKSTEELVYSYKNVHIWKGRGSFVQMQFIHEIWRGICFLNEEKKNIYFSRETEEGAKCFHWAISGVPFSPLGWETL